MLTLDGSWPDVVIPAILATVDTVKSMLPRQWRAIVAVGSLGYGGYVAGWSDCDIDVLMEESAEVRADWSILLSEEVHRKGFADVDVKCYRLSDLNCGNTLFPFGCVNRLIMLQESARLICGEFNRMEVRKVTRPEIIAESLEVLNYLANQDTSWWRTRPIDDLAAHVALPGRLLYTVRTGSVGNKKLGLSELVNIEEIRIRSDFMRAIEWSSACRHEEVSRAISEPLFLEVAKTAHELAKFVSLFVKQGRSD